MYYPVMLDLKNRHVLFVGGGWETTHKVRGLHDAGALVTLLCSNEQPELEALAANNSITWCKRDYRDGDLEGFWLVMIHTGNKNDNPKIQHEAERLGMLCNAVDDPERCNFILPSVHRQGDLVIAVSTSGTAPALGVRIKQKFMREYGEAYKTFLRLLRELRPGITVGFENFETRKQLWYALVDGAALTKINNNDQAAALEVLNTTIAAQRATCHATRCAGCSEHCPAHTATQPLTHA